MISRIRYRLNHRIQTKEVRLISDTGENLGVVDTQTALRQAQEKDLDLVEISPNVTPPVAKILDFGKFLYQEKQKQQKGKAKQKGGDMKILKLRPNTGEHDLTQRVRRAKEFLEEKDKVTFVVEFRGREMAYPELGREKLEYILKELGDTAKIESGINRKGRFLNVVVAPK